MLSNNFALFYFFSGLVVCVINGAVRKIEADGLLALAWILLWPFTPIGYICRGTEWLYNKIKHYQPLRRLRIFYLRNF
jgi:ABC-type polysaccharide/polyol phosphate export permease